MKFNVGYNLLIINDNDYHYRSINCFATKHKTYGSGLIHGRIGIYENRMDIAYYGSNDYGDGLRLDRQPS
ncbi:hypothetical protein D3C79_1096180 [compost metagenome]